jgi:NAD(P)-dependent dehydrogenase (short-subunit alcohol dehydrogenase family)
VFVTMDQLDPETWSKVLDTNLTGAWRLAQRAHPHMVKQGGGAIVLLSSLAGQLAAMKGGAYAVSKAGVDHLGRQLAAEWGPQQIRVNVVAPGTTRTDMIRAIVSNEKVMKAVENQAPLKRIGEPEDVAAAILFLASDAARHITGQRINVDGGATLTGGLT